MIFLLSSEAFDLGRPENKFPIQARDLAKVEGQQRDIHDLAIDL